MIAQSIKMATKSILANKMRSFLTMLGIIIGVISLVVLVSLVTSATNSVTDEISSMGNDLLTVSIFDDKGNPLKLSDMDDLAEKDSIALVAPTTQFEGVVKSGVDSIMVQPEGTNGAFFQIQNKEALYGRLLKESDLENGNYVTVLSYETANKIFDTTDVVGEYIVLNGYKFLVVGVLEKDDLMMATFYNNYPLYIPYTVATRITSVKADVTSIYISAKDAANMNIAEDELTNTMMSRFKNDDEAFYIMNQNTLAETLGSVTAIFSLLLGGIAAISLLVGGIGIMNIMLVSVTERTKEIGIRKAIGANDSRIMLQFLIESLIICLLGCAFGVIISMAILAGINAFVEEVTFSMSFGVLLVAVTFSTTIGIGFGLYPARKAAKMNPIDALRFE